MGGGGSQPSELDMYPPGLADFTREWLACGVDGPLGCHSLRRGATVDPRNENLFSRKII